MDTIDPPEGGILESDLCCWIGAAAPGDRFVYHRGFLAADVDPTSNRLTPKQKEQLRRVAGRAMLAAENGLVHLLQSRNRPGDYTYIAAARPRPRTESALLEVILAEGALSAAPLVEGSCP